uniref:DH domain-containing protein n=1 Tax=Megaselia scalaris TaxID=36166 RepID=T1GQX0_MEGSC
MICRERQDILSWIPNEYISNNSKSLADSQYQNDSGVDMSNIKLPELPGPPTPTSNLYSTLKKLKNFVTNKKSPKSKNKTYESTQFYVPSSTSASTPQLNLQSPDSDPNNCYENVNFETSKSTEKIKPKESNRIKSKLRKSLVIFDSNSNLSSPSEGKSTFYTTGSESSQNLTSNESIIPKKFPTLVKKNKNSKTQRRKTSTDISVPSPEEPIYANKMKSSTSWYTECGVFKESLPNITVTPTMSEERSSNGHTSWYAEAGLYQSNGSRAHQLTVLVAFPRLEMPTHTKMPKMCSQMSHYIKFTMPPKLNLLPEIWKMKGIVHRLMVMRKLVEELTTTMHRQCHLCDGKVGLQLYNWSVRSRDLRGRFGVKFLKSNPVKFYVITLTANERKVQEAKFEIVTSEASYLKSLNLLRSHFMNHPALRDSSVLSSSDRKKLFGLISPVIECSNAFLKALENCWQENIMLLDISKIIYESADKHFHVYIKFCEHQAEMDRTLRRLKENKNGVFNKTLEVLESDATCCGLTLHSFLMLPMQRITRLPLLVDAVFSKIHYASDEHECWKMTLAMLNKFAQQCNDAATKCEQAYEMQRLSSQIEFPSHIAPIPINPTGILSPGTKPDMLSRLGNCCMCDLLVLTKKKTDEQYSVFDYCARSLITISSGEEMLQHLNTGKDTTLIGKNLILLTLLENHEKKTVEMYLSCKTVSEQQRWLQAINPSRESEIPGEKLYEDWDCPQVTVKHEYSSTEPDALNLEPGDIVNVFRKLPDGWYHGERIRDGACGWFPGSYTEEINQLHVRSRNLKQRHRLLTFTAAYLDSQKKQIARVS